MAKRATLVAAPQARPVVLGADALMILAGIAFGPFARGFDLIGVPAPVPRVATRARMSEHASASRVGDPVIIRTTRHE